MVGGHARDRSHGICEATGKVKLGKDAAREAARNMRNKQHETKHSGAVHEYVCDDCGWWHIGHRWVAAGRVPKARLSRPIRRPVSNIDDIFPPPVVDITSTPG